MPCRATTFALRLAKCRQQSGTLNVSVEIYRIAGRGGDWSLEVIDREGASTVWDDIFADDQDAYGALESEGIRSL
jgi:hypothetical protein